MTSAPAPSTALHAERLWPAPWVFVVTALVIPASLLVFLPISLEAGIATAIVLYAGIVVVLLTTTPRVEVRDGVLTAGRAHIPVGLLGAATAVDGEEARAERGVRLDARAWLLLRGWIPGLVRVELEDPDDPTPYWLVSTRHPTALAAAIERARSDAA